MTTQPGKRPRALIALLACVFFQAVSAVAGGIGLVSAPDGSAVAMPLSWLEGSPFSDYLIPGLILLVVLGLGALLVFVGLLRRVAWGWWGSVALGVALVIWIVVEIAVVGYQGGVGVVFWVVYGGLGAVILLLSLRPSVRTYLMTGGRAGERVA